MLDTPVLGIRTWKRHLRTLPTEVLAWLNDVPATERFAGSWGGRNSAVVPRLQRLMGKNTAASRRRIHELISAITELQSTVRSAAQSLSASGQPLDRMILKPPRKVSALLNEVDARLEQYPTWPTADIDDDYRSIYFEHSFTASTRPEGECIAAHAVVKLANMRQLDRFGQCECGKYFFGRVSHQRFCSPSCRQKHHGHSGKKNRAEYMRWYYAMYQSPHRPRNPITFEQWKKANRKANKNAK